MFKMMCWFGVTCIRNIYTQEQYDDNPNTFELSLQLLWRCHVVVHDTIKNTSDHRSSAWFFFSFGCFLSPISACCDEWTHGRFLLDKQHVLGCVFCYLLVVCTILVSLIMMIIEKSFLLLYHGSRLDWRYVVFDMWAWERGREGWAISSSLFRTGSNVRWPYRDYESSSGITTYYTMKTEVTWRI